MSEIILFQRAAAPSAPNAGAISLYAKNDTKLYYKLPDATEREILTALGSSPSFVNLTVTGIADFAAGSAATPSARWGGDTTSGIYRPAANQLAFSSSGVQKATFDTASLALASGVDLGIGMTPVAVANSASLTLNATTNNFQRFYIGTVEKGRFTFSSTLGRIDHFAGGLLFDVPTGNTIKSQVNDADVLSLSSAGAQLTGTLGIGTTAPTIAALAIIPNSTGTGANQYGIDNQPIVSSGATASGNGLYSRVDTPAVAFTCAVIRAIQVDDSQKGAGSTITELQGIKVENLTAGGINKGIVCNVSSGTNKWNLSAEGTAANYMAGKLQVGTSTEVSSVYTTEITGSTRGAFIKSTAGATGETLSLHNSATSGDNFLAGLYTEASATLKGSIDYNRAGNAIRFNTTSDMDLKIDLGPMEEIGSLLDKIQLHKYMVKETNYITGGVFAQELFPLFPEAVVVGDGKNPWMVNKSEMIWPLLKEVQSLRKRVATLESKLH